ncbi:MAG: glycoside hydrolase family 65 protein, partial [Lachnospiraceae bacterium]|nr:glycoside hydrolase family 65 protein [Lachnospiraceae bacterium]
KLLGEGSAEEEGLKKRLEDNLVHLCQKEPGEDGRIEQFDGYFSLEDASVEEVRSRLKHPKEYWGGAYGVASDTQVIKQADVVTRLVMFPEDYETGIKWKNWEYYEERTEHGSSLSACMYSILACQCGKKEFAYPFFLKSANADRIGGGKEWAGDVYIGGTHPAAAGGAYMSAIYGFGGLRESGGTLSAKPCLPDQWKKLQFHVYFKGEWYLVTESGEEVLFQKE